MSNIQFFLLQYALPALSRSNAQFAELDCFGTMACFLLWKAAPFGSRPQPMKFKMTNAVMAAVAHFHQQQRDAVSP